MSALDEVKFQLQRYDDLTRAVCKRFGFVGRDGSALAFRMIHGGLFADQIPYLPVGDA